jgi:hypothetical protein
MEKHDPKADYIDGIVFGFLMVAGMWFGFFMINPAY